MHIGNTITQDIFAFVRQGLLNENVITETLTVGDEGFELCSEQEKAALRYEELGSFLYTYEDQVLDGQYLGMLHSLALLRENERHPTVLRMWDCAALEERRSAFGFRRRIRVSPGPNPAICQLVQLLTQPLADKMATKWQAGDSVGCFTDNWRCVGELKEAGIYGLSRWLGRLIEIPITQVNSVTLTDSYEMEVCSMQKQIRIPMSGWNTWPFFELVAAICSADDSVS